VVDLSETTFMDSTGISVIIQAVLDLDRDPTRVILQNPCGPVLRVLQVTGIDELVTIEGKNPTESGLE
jgi:anti-anti-sigma factor